MQNAAPQLSQGFERQPLCLRYSALHVAAVRASVRDHAAHVDFCILCGFGAMANGHATALGLWPAAAFEPELVHLIVDDLVVRGMQRVSLLLNGGSEELGAAVLRAFPGASVALPFHPMVQLALSVALPGDRKAVLAGLNRIRRAQSREHADAILDMLAASAWQGAPASVQVSRAAIRQWQAIYALPRRTRERVRCGEDAAWQLQQGVSRALARQGAFENAHDAAAFAEAWLFDAEGRARRQRLAAARRADLAAAAAAAALA
jgi:transposase-like protein